MSDVCGISADRLRSFIERIENLTEEKIGLGKDITEVFLEAKAHGFDVKAMRACIKLRKLDSAERTEQEAMIDLYMLALEQPRAVPISGHSGKAAKSRSVQILPDDPETGEVFDSASAPPAVASGVALPSAVPNGGATPDPIPKAASDGPTQADTSEGVAIRKDATSEAAPSISSPPSPVGDSAGILPSAQSGAVPAFSESDALDIPPCLRRVAA